MKCLIIIDARCKHEEYCLEITNLKLTPLSISHQLTGAYSSYLQNYEEKDVWENSEINGKNILKVTGVKMGL